MLTKKQKFVMYVLVVLSILISIITCIPFRSLTFINTVNNLFVIENVIKFVAFPIIVLGLALFPNLLKYGEIKGRNERSKTVNVLSYLPLVLYVLGALIFSLHTLTFKLMPMSNGAHSILLALITIYIILLLCSIPLINNLTMRFEKNGNLWLDGIVALTYVVVIILCWRIATAYDSAYAGKQGFIYSASNNDPYLFFLYLGIIVGTIVCLFKTTKLIKSDEAVVYVFDPTEQYMDKVILREYEDAYNDILDDFEDYFDQTLLEETEEVEETEEAQEVEEDEAVEEVQEVEEDEAAEEVQEDEEDEEDEAAEEVQEVEEDEASKSKYEEKKRLVIAQIEELNELLAKTDSMNDQEVSNKVHTIKGQIEAEKETLIQVRNEFDELRNSYSAKIAELQAKVDEIPTEEEIEEVQEEEVVEVKKKVFKPTLEAILDFVADLKEKDGNTWDEKGSITDGLGTVKFSKERVPFLTIQGTKSDYRVTFKTTVKKWSTFLTEYKGVTIPKKAKGNNWLLLVNKGTTDTSALKAMIKESVKGVNEEINAIKAAKEAEKARKAEEKKRLAAEKKAAKLAEKQGTNEPAKNEAVDA